MKKILIVFGTRPEAIKMAPLVKELQKYPHLFKTYVCLTAQHRELLDQVLSIFEIEADFDLNIMKANQGLTDVTVRILNGMKEVLEKTAPDLVLVHGDTTTSMATSLSAFYQKIPVGHIEAGLRTYNIYSPWPEEINRQITGRIATWHFAPTERSRKFLIQESVPSENIFVTGNTVIDALYSTLHHIHEGPQVVDKIQSELIQFGLPEAKLNAWKGNAGERKMVLITGHRRENFGDGFLRICTALKDLTASLPFVDFVYPMHLNPNVREPIHSIFGKNEGSASSNIFFIEPLSYLPFVYLMEKSAIILTDSGGVQEEAPSLGKPVLVMRDTSERPEAIESGIVKLVGTDEALIRQEVTNLLNHQQAYEAMSNIENPYGDGKASERIISIIKTILTSD